MAGDWEFDWDIREACPNRAKYLGSAVDAVADNYSDVEVVDRGTEIGPCFYLTTFRLSVSNPEDYKTVALAVARLNQFIRDVKAIQASYGWAVSEKEAYVEGNHVYMAAVWVKKVRIPGRRYVSVMELYEFALPYMAVKPTRALGAAVVAVH